MKKELKKAFGELLAEMKDKALAEKVVEVWAAIKTQLN